MNFIQDLFPLTLMCRFPLALPASLTLATPLNAEVQKRQKLGVFRRQRATE